MGAEEERISLLMLSASKFMEFSPKNP